MDIYESIKTSLIKTVKQVYPEHKIFAEDIKKLNDEIEKNHINDYIFTALYPVTNQYCGDFVDRTILVSISVHDSAETIGEYLRGASKLEKAFYPAFHFDDRFITIENTASNIVDWKLHFSFNLTFRDKMNEKQDDSAYLEDLTMKY